MQSTHLREHNLSAVLRALQAAGEPTSRAGLASLTRLTKPTVSKLVEELIGAGLISEGDPISAGAGRPMVPLRPAAGTLLAIGLEIAADHVSCLGVDLTGSELSRRTVYGRAASAEEAIARAAQLVREVRADAPDLPVVGVVAAVPGRISPDGRLVLSAPNLDWTDVPLVEGLRTHLAPEAGDIVALNDNRLSVLTEIDRRPSESFLYVRGSTGVGGAVVLEGSVLEGTHGWAGELGHTVVEPGGLTCRCGRRGCLEAYISYHALVEQAGLGPEVRIEDLVDELSRSSSRAEVIGVIGRSLGLAIANALNILDLSTVVLSGYLAPIAEEITPVVRETVTAHALAAEAGPISIERSDTTPDPALRGAARAALQPVFDAPGAWISRAATPAGRTA
ncbi:transcriptional regulator [Brachybacterium sp. SGAir0954]|uniref:ROK family transcriptional regulator n=1 Tax=Brachybacterium sp. SGAir0954 TaxID=2571029 RepID=UPI0010CD234B|nr:ROK family transcriptional regulator [Brachybacterium sp. SGAir0954]QCR52502.1 transcriptional regulator [Brachybacterium sp. SGAir0954]